MDRFSSKEDAPRWNGASFAAGQIARRRGKAIDSCPHKDNNWIAKSWRAGWRDEDMSIAAESHA